MAFADFSEQSQGITLLQRSLERGRLGHAYLFSGAELASLEALARTLAKTLNCQQPKKTNGKAVDCCDECPTCRKIGDEAHGDMHWVRPESKSRIVSVDQMRELMREIQLKPNDAEFKVAVIVAADRLNPQAANAFLKTLEEPPSKSVLILLTTEPGRILETIISRCLRLNFGGESTRRWDDATQNWLNRFGEMAGGEQKSLLGRYRLMDVLAARLSEMKTTVEEELTAKSPLEKYDDVEKDLRERWEDELKAAIEAEYRRRRGELLLGLQWWFRDVWLHTLTSGREFLSFPDADGTANVAKRITPHQARENLRVMEQTQRLLFTNVQEALALEVGLLKLNL
ncbi:MAG: DNA polymerase III subunit [Verrucomicrobiota bacterium]